ncbi:hypothetical protein [Synechococcus sp. MVIR-18-1]|uniref:hypothetical protein n=1 Tax=Synechococcus sp. MVIR-18-1 TaxID=1386941 RepID=UPI001647E2EC|nr:hypothetical protein [Synechococcus sp. MVIR-18-1]
MITISAALTLRKMGAFYSASGLTAEMRWSTLKDSTSRSTSEIEVVEHRGEHPYEEAG